jgi:hypothetical protein
MWVELNLVRAAFTGSDKGTAVPSYVYIGQQRRSVVLAN